MRASLATVVVASILAVGCTEDPSPTALPRFPAELSSDERAAFDERLRRELAAGRARKARLIAENRRVLNALPRIPGSKVLSEAQNPEDHELDEEEDVGQAEFELYASDKLAYPDYADLTATGWGTFRDYSIPSEMATRDVRDFFVRRLQGTWQVNPDVEAGVSFAKGRRCVWFHIGIRTGAELRGEAAPGRSYEVATDLRPGRGDC